MRINKKVQEFYTGLLNVSEAKVEHEVKSEVKNDTEVKTTKIINLK